MIEKNEKQVENKYQIHYYFEDENLHSMDAFLRNKAEKHFLEAVKNISELIEFEIIRFETEAFEEGGLKENLIISGIFTTLAFLSPSINNLITYYFTNDYKLKEEQIRNLNLDSALKKIELEKKLKALYENPIIKKDVSSFYQKVNKSDKLVEIGFVDIDNNIEKKVNKRIFKDFIINDITQILIDDNAEIEIISPILNLETYKWRGIYSGKEIVFSMGDTGFKKEVLEGKYKFSSKSTIHCILQITYKFNEESNEEKYFYSVKSVLKVNDSIGKNRVTNKGNKYKKIKYQKLQATLFDNLE